MRSTAAAFSTARRALVSSRSLAGRSVAPSAAASGAGRRRSRRAPRRSPRADRRARSASLTAAPRRARRSGADPHAALGERRCEVHAAPGLALTTSRRSRSSDGPVDRQQLAFADRAGELGLQRRVGAAGATAQPVVVELDHVGDARRHGSHRQVRLSARAAGGTDPARSPARRAASAAGSRSRRGAIHSWMSNTRAANVARLVGAEQMAVVLQRCAAPGGVDEDRGVAGHRRHRPPRQLRPPRRGARRARAAHHSTHPTAPGMA